MHSEFYLACESAMFEDVPKEEQFPAQSPVLAHYTTVATLEKIVRNDELWLSHPFHMNDQEELRWGLDEGVRVFQTHPSLLKACGDESRFHLLLQDFNRRSFEFTSVHAANIYVACFCMHDARDKDGILSMWRGYGANGGGVAIIIDTSKLGTIDNSPFVLHSITYLSKAKRYQWIDQTIKKVADLIEKYKPSDDELWKAGAHFFERLKLFALFTKHEGFSEEKEWRLAYLGDRDGDRKFHDKLSYLVTEKGVVPKLKLKIAPNEGFDDPELSMSRITHSILLGPALTAPLTKLAVERLLVAADKTDLSKKVSVSSIPFRASY